MTALRIGRTKMKMGKPDATVEDLVWTISGGKISLAWENHVASTFPWRFIEP